MSSTKIDLRKLPIWQQYAIAIIIAMAWMVGRNWPVPAWINNYLVPFAGWFGNFCHRLPAPFRQGKVAALTGASPCLD
jgi:hypothetical protein